MDLAYDCGRSVHGGRHAEQLVSAACALLCRFIDISCCQHVPDTSEDASQTLPAYSARAVESACSTCAD